MNEKKYKCIFKVGSSSKLRSANDIIADRIFQKALKNQKLNDDEKLKARDAIIRQKYIIKSIKAKNFSYKLAGTIPYFLLAFGFADHISFYALLGRIHESQEQIIEVRQTEEFKDQYIKDFGSLNFGPATYISEQQYYDYTIKYIKQHPETEYYSILKNSETYAHLGAAAAISSFTIMCGSFKMLFDREEAECKHDYHSKEKFQAEEKIEVLSRSL